MPVTLMNDDTYINEKCESIIFVVTDLPFFMHCSREFHMNFFLHAVTRMHNRNGNRYVKIKIISI